MSETRFVPIKSIQPNPDQPRRFFDPAELNALAASLKEHRGVIQPIILMPNGSDDTFILIDGERRWKAAELAGLKTIEAIIRPRLDDGPLLETAFLANLHRSDLNPIEEAMAYRDMKEKLNLSSEAVARRVGKSSATIYNTLKWLTLEPEIQELVATYQLPRDPRVADALLSVQAGEFRVKLARRMARPGVKIKTIELACASIVESMKKTRIGKGRSRSLEPSPHPMLDLASVRANGPLPDAAQPVAVDSLREAAQAMCAQCQIKVDVLKDQFAEPAWLLLANAADATCQACGMSDVAGACDACPGVELLKRVSDRQRQTTGGRHARS